MRCHMASIVVLSLVLNMTGCATWTTTQAPLKELEGKKVRLTTTEGTRVAGRLIAVDSLGFAVVRRKLWAPRASIDTTTIAKVERRKFSTSRTAVLIPIFAVAFAIEMAILTNAMWED
jgi:hypothetical protein